MNRWLKLPVTALLCAASSCEDSEGPRGARVEVKQLTGNTFELLPTTVAVPMDKDGNRYCLAFTQSETGIIRQLTMTTENKSVRCAPGRPIGNVHFRIPPDEGAVQVHVFFSDRKLNAGSIAAQLYDHKGDPSFHPMNLRLPGGVVVETLRFEPRQTVQPSPTMGAEIGPAGEIRDGGTVDADTGASTFMDSGDAPSASADAGGATPGTNTVPSASVDAGSAR